jgi:hypothetical protein
MYRIKIFSSFGKSENCKINFETVFESNKLDFYGENKKIFLTNDDDYTHVIILNTAMPKLNIPKENVVGLAFEPFEFLGLSDHFIQYAQKHIGRYLIGNKRELPEPFIEHFSFMWHNNPRREIVLKPSKNVMSIVLSEKNNAPGHKYRHVLVTNIINNNLPIDIYGRGAKKYKGINVKGDVNVKGEFQNTEPYNDYLFSICIENFQSNDYFSEKILDPILHNTVPIYLGAKNILNYFNEVIILTGDIIQDMNKIEYILKNPMEFYKKTYHDDNLKNTFFFFQQLLSKSR